MITYLYIKTHNKTGLRYFGKTINDPFTYKGSGTRWLNHLYKHGNDVTTEVLFESEDLDELSNVAIAFSLENNIVESNEWANLMIELVNHGGPIGSKGPKKPISEETRKKLSASRIGRAISQETKDKISMTMSGRPSNRTGKKNTTAHKRKIAAAHKGSKWWNNGEAMTRSKSCPGPEWSQGMLKNH